MKYTPNPVPPPSFNHSTASEKKEINKVLVILKVVEIKVN